jgi:hypothetical protein
MKGEEGGLDVTDFMFLPKGFHIKSIRLTRRISGWGDVKILRKMTKFFEKGGDRQSNGLYVPPD